MACGVALDTQQQAQLGQAGMGTHGRQREGERRSLCEG
jgi:hypothetical protein